MRLGFKCEDKGFEHLDLRLGEFIVRKKPVTVSAPRISFLVVVLLLSGLVPFSSSSLRRAEASPPTAISPTPADAGGLHTIVTPGSVPTGLCSGNCVITGGTRPGGGTNLFHSFGQFNVGSGDITTFQNGISFNANGTQFIAGLATSNILARITGTNGNNPSLSTIYGTIRTAADFGNANLFLMNPAGFLFGPNATVNVGGMMTFTTADYIKLTDGGRFNANPNTLPADILTAYPVSAFGFLDPTVAPIAPITVYGMTVQGPMPTDPDTGAPLGQKVALVGGNITFTSDPESGTPSTVTAPGRQIQITSVAGEGKVDANSLTPEAGMALGTITLDPGTGISTAGDPLFGNGSGGSISIRGGQFVATAATIITSPAALSTGSGGDVTVSVTGSATFTDNTFIQTADGVQQDGITPLNAGPAGAVSITANDSLSMTNTVIDTSTVSATGNSGLVTLTTNGPLSLTDSYIYTISSGSGNGGEVSIAGKDVTLTRAAIQTDVDTGGVNLITTQAAGQVHPGAVTVTAENTVTFSGSFNDDLGFPVISAMAFGTLPNAGSVTITGKTVNLSNGTIAASMFSGQIPSPGNGGAIEIRGNNVTLSQFELQSTNAGLIASTGKGGSVLLGGPDNLPADNIQLTASFVTTASASGGGAGNIEFQTKALTLSDHTKVLTSAFGLGSGGMVTVSGAENVTIESGSNITSKVVFPGAGIIPDQGAAGNILLETQNLTIRGGGRITATADANSLGDAGNITVQGTNGSAQSVLIDGPGSGIFTDTQGAGAGGNIDIASQSLTLQNGGTVSSTSVQAQGGDITITAGQSVTLNNGSSISASSTGAGNAGNIQINAGQSFVATNSSVTTQANLASGGIIKITTTPGGTVQLTNSLISASVLDGKGGGGSVNIDPQFVILLNSKILANAVQGPGGNISITTNLLLPDANSVISASSQFGVNGTVTIQSPNAPGAGEIQPLGKSPLLATSLLNQRCASLAGGEFSSFTVAGRDSLPTEPGSWLASPLYAAGVGTGLEARGEGRASVGELAGETPLLSLRQIAPAGFLTQAFAVDWSASCTS